MNTKLTLKIALVVLPLALTLTGCTTPVLTEYEPNGDIKSRADLERERPYSWERFEVIDDTHIRVFFSGGAGDCDGYRTEVKETPETIQINLFQGSFPGGPDMCRLTSNGKKMLVETEAPIGDREIIPGPFESSSFTQ